MWEWGGGRAGRGPQVWGAPMGIGKKKNALTPALSPLSPLSPFLHSMKTMETLQLFRGDTVLLKVRRGRWWWCGTARARGGP